MNVRQKNTQKICSNFEFCFIFCFIFLFYLCFEFCFIILFILFAKLNDTIRKKASKKTCCLIFNCWFKDGKASKAILGWCLCIFYEQKNYAFSPFAPSSPPPVLGNLRLMSICLRRNRGGIAMSKTKEPIRGLDWSQ